jgi:hypothetical protein
MGKSDNYKACQVDHTLLPQILMQGTINEVCASKEYSPTCISIGGDLTDVKLGRLRP